MAATLTPYSSSLLLPRRKVTALQNWKTLPRSVYPSSKYNFFQQPGRRAITKLQFAGDVIEPNNVSSYINRLVDKVQEVSPKSLKEFPWGEAKEMVFRRLILLGTEAFEWSFIGLYSLSFLADIFLSIARDRELFIPVGLFIGVAVAELFKEWLQEFLKANAEDKNFFKCLLAIGSFFVLVKFVSLCVKIQARILLSHIGNGGLMQVLWLARKLQQADDIKNMQSTIGPGESS